MSLRIPARLEVWWLTCGLWLDDVWGICSWQASQFGERLMIYQLPDSGPKGMARLDLYYLSIFAPRLLCSSTFQVERVLVYRVFTTFWVHMGIKVQFPVRSYIKRRMKSKTESRGQWERRACTNMCPCAPPPTVALAQLCLAWEQKPLAKTSTQQHQPH